MERLIHDMSFRLEQRFGIKMNPKECLSSVKDNGFTYAHAYWNILRNIYPDKNKSILGDKESMAWTKIPNFLDMFQNGKAIVLVRDPRDIVGSFKKITIAPKHDYLIALFNAVDAINHAVRYVQRYPDKVCMVQFEKLKQNTENEVKRLCEFLNVDFVDDMLDVSRYTDHFGNKWDDTASKTYPKETDRLAPVARWKKNLDSDDLFLCEWIAKKQISMIGLPLSGRKFSDKDFERAMEKIMSSELLRNAFKRWCDTGEGVEQFPLDPTKPENWEPTNWQPTDINNPSDFK